MEGVPDLPVAPQDEAGLTTTFQTWERTAFFKAVSEGIKDFRAIAIVGGHKDAEELEFAYPCGVCRQVMQEFCDVETFQIIVAKSENEYQVYKLKELLPYGFGPENLKGDL